MSLPTDFYPTPPGLISRMLDCVDWRYVSNVLEPSAGKGDLADAIKQRMESIRGSRSSVAVDCIELDPNLQHIVKNDWKRYVAPTGSFGRPWHGNCTGVADALHAGFGPLRSLRVLFDTGHEVELQRWEQTSLYGVEYPKFWKWVMRGPGIGLFERPHDDWPLGETTDTEAVERAISAAVEWIEKGNEDD